jgi:hypothetical protein
MSRYYFYLKMRLLGKIKKLICKIRGHKWEEHWHKTQEGNFSCKYCGKFVRWDDD